MFLGTHNCSIRNATSRIDGLRIGVALQHIPGKLDNRHPATRRYMHSTNDLDMALRDAVRRDAPAGIASRVSRQAILKVEELGQ